MNHLALRVQIVVDTGPTCVVVQQSVVEVGAPRKRMMRMRSMRSMCRLITVHCRLLLGIVHLNVIDLITVRVVGQIMEAKYSGFAQFASGSQFGGFGSAGASGYGLGEVTFNTPSSAMIDPTQGGSSFQLFDALPHNQYEPFRPSFNAYPMEHPITDLQLGNPAWAQFGGENNLASTQQPIGHVEEEQPRPRRSTRPTRPMVCGTGTRHHRHI
ncbi:PREDICTED: uncharacterized protein LOC109173061 [Ipomoea nil]|uniref:uncharacterized protein LOC109173061 n=1 Tax=Ipomoea nil TaxID=35883 RepID=UPI0009013A91|nr:PREDICTED: uncharacterized protein LOC109173061 [Ipomoea nil]